MAGRGREHRRDSTHRPAGPPAADDPPGLFTASDPEAPAGEAGEPRKSKSQRKREALALQALGESLIALGEADLARIPMWPDLEAAVLDARGLERTARRRQMRYIGRLLRDGDPAPIARAVETVRRPGRREAARQRRIERMRDTLMRDDRALGDLRAAVPGPDFQQLRRLVAAARRERESASGGAGERRLFRFLRDRALDALDDGQA